MNVGSVRETLLSNRVEDVNLEQLREISPYATKLAVMYSKMGGFSARYVSKAIEVAKEMIADSGCTVFLAFTANLVATGLRGVLAAMIEEGLIDAVVTTGGTFDHDIARSLSCYYVGEFELDDSMLWELEIHRLGNVLVPKESYGPVVEEFTHKMLEELVARKSRWTPSELAREVGLRLKDGTSILAAAARKGIPVFSPGIIDSAFGTAVFTFNEVGRSRGYEIQLDVLGDMSTIANLVMDSERLGAIALGGGISKHHVIWWAQFKGGLDYAVYITTATEFDGSLSGARTREAISWGKMKPNAKHVTVPADATLVFPIIAAALLGDQHGRL